MKVYLVMSEAGLYHVASTEEKASEFIESWSPDFRRCLWIEEHEVDVY